MPAAATLGEALSWQDTDRLSVCEWLLPHELQQACEALRDVFTDSLVRLTEAADPIALIAKQLLQPPWECIAEIFSLVAGVDVGKAS